MTKKWVLFDGDNTLWNVEALYDDARVRFCEYVLQYITELGLDPDRHIDLDLIERCQKHRDLQLHKSLGYSSERFSKSFEDTLLFLFPNASPQIVRHACSLATTVFDTKATPLDGVDSIFSRLRNAGYSLAIISAGERWVQEKRLKDFPWFETLHACSIVERKTEQEFTIFCRDQGVEVSTSWMVGDSVRSDILPARAAGLNAIHLLTRNWSAEHAPIPDNVPSISSLEEILPIILSLTDAV